jgi:release factor glutamine methyltransferase
VTRAQALAALRDRLTTKGIESPERDAEWLLLHALGIPRSAFWADPRLPLRDDEAARLESLARRRERREPLQHLLGEVPFHGVALEVEPGVFIPRPETEDLVEAVLRALAERGETSAAAPTGSPPIATSTGVHAPAGTLLDWGCGTGAIAVALLSALPGWKAVAADRNPRAVSLAARNAQRNGVAARLRLVVADFSTPAAVGTPAASGAAALPGAPAAPNAPAVPGAPFDLVVSNPPYVRRGDIETLMPEVRDHDPAEALDGGPDGLDAHRALAAGLAGWLRPGGLFALEIGAEQADDALGIFCTQVRDARVLPDGAGRPRIMIGTMRGEGR